MSLSMEPKFWKKMVNTVQDIEDTEKEKKMFAF